MTEEPPHAGTPRPPRRERRAERPLLSGWGVLGLVALAIVLSGIALLGAAGYLYYSDHGFGAHVTGKSCTGPLRADTSNRIDLRTTFLDIDRSIYGVPDTACSVITRGNFVEHHIRSRHTIIYESEGGDCLYDTRRGIDC